MGTSAFGQAGCVAGWRRESCHPRNLAALLSSTADGSDRCRAFCRLKTSSVPSTYDT